MIGEINRSIVIARPKEPYLEWARSVAEEGEEVTLAHLRTDCTAFLIPPYADETNQQEVLEQCFGLLFEEGLAGWEDDENTWPAERDLKTFLSWFDVDFSSLAIDLVEEPVEIDEPEETEVVSE